LDGSLLPTVPLPIDHGTAPLPVTIKTHPDTNRSSSSLIIFLAGLIEHRLLELVRAYKIASEDSTLAETWRSRPGAFETATGESVFPGPWSDELDQEFEEVYRKTMNVLEGKKGTA
jgi:hypothetical protein